eukprot:TRINITY_DN2183_c0_g1_i5.p1 TRINITY_DN2183_c0_g1~~TRINITY_DN2183_c0_g1_i5.p1  ORF type:complete len:767 (+),score=351.13 TRINITY_DN2183_c0_g1_i5:135-2435(+)
MATNNNITTTEPKDLMFQYSSSTGTPYTTSTSSISPSSVAPQFNFGSLSQPRAAEEIRHDNTTISSSDSPTYSFNYPSLSSPISSVTESSLSLSSSSPSSSLPVTAAPPVYPTSTNVSPYAYSTSHPQDNVYFKLVSSASPPVANLGTTVTPAPFTPPPSSSLSPSPSPTPTPTPALASPTSASMNKTPINNDTSFSSLVSFSMPPATSHSPSSSTPSSSSLSSSSQSSSSSASTSSAPVWSLAELNNTKSLPEPSFDLSPSKQQPTQAASKDTHIIHPQSHPPQPGNALGLFPATDNSQKITQLLEQMQNNLNLVVSRLDGIEHRISTLEITSKEVLNNQKSIASQTKKLQETVESPRSVPQPPNNSTFVPQQQHHQQQQHQQPSTLPPQSSTIYNSNMMTAHHLPPPPPSSAPHYPQGPSSVFPANNYEERRQVPTPATTMYHPPAPSSYSSSYEKPAQLGTYPSIASIPPHVPSSSFSSSSSSSSAHHHMPSLVPVTSLSKGANQYESDEEMAKKLQAQFNQEGSNSSSTPPSSSSSSSSRPAATSSTSTRPATQECPMCAKQVSISDLAAHVEQHLEDEAVNGTKDKPKDSSANPAAQKGFFGRMFSKDEAKPATPPSETAPAVQSSQPSAASSQSVAIKPTNPAPAPNNNVKVQVQPAPYYPQQARPVPHMNQMASYPGAPVGVVPMGYPPVNPYAYPAPPPSSRIVVAGQQLQPQQLQQLQQQQQQLQQQQQQYASPQPMRQMMYYPSLDPSSPNYPPSI